MDVLSRLKLLNALMALTPPAMFPVRSFTGKGICLHESVKGLNLNRRAISELEPEMLVIEGEHTYSICWLCRLCLMVSDNVYSVTYMPMSQMSLVKQSWSIIWIIICKFTPLLQAS